MRQYQQNDGPLYDLTNKDPYKTLYISVIIQAFLDLTKPKKENESSSITLHRDQAEAWFFSSIGVTCEDFEVVCQYAGVLPEKIRSFAYEVINSGDTEDVRRTFQNLL